jgi:hypothetical protein
MGYENSKIYRLLCEDGHYYYGSTIAELRSRLWGHKDSSKTMTSRVYTHINSIGWDKVRIELVESFSCKNRLEIRMKENEYINAAKSDILCLNTLPAFASDEEKQQRAINYYEKNKDSILERNKKYMESHKDDIVEKRKEHYEKNKSTIQSKNKEYLEQNKDRVRQQRKQFYEQNKERLLAEKREKRSINKEETRNKRKEYRDKNREHINAKKREAYMKSKISDDTQHDNDKK